MRKRLLPGLALTIAFFSFGCQGTVTPFTRGTERAVDPMLSLEEQKVMGRSFYAYPDSMGVLPAQSNWREYYYR